MSAILSLRVVRFRLFGYTGRMNVLTNFRAALKPTFKRFPVVILMGFSAVVFFGLQSVAWELFPTIDLDVHTEAFNLMKHRQNAFESLMKSLFRAALMAEFLSIFFQLFGEWLSDRLQGKTKLLQVPFISQILGALSFIPAFLIFRGDIGSRMNLSYWGIILSLVPLCVFMLLCMQKEDDVAPNCIVSGVIAGIASFCLGGGLGLIYASSRLIFPNIPEWLEDFIISFIVMLSFLVFFISIFLSYAAKPKDEITVPKAFKTIILYMITPLYLILVGVLYLYLLKSLFTWTMPSGKINPFVSTASAVYLLLYFSIKRFDTRFTRFFTKWVPLILFPLIAVQCIAFGIRINAYGYTCTRYASLLYIIFSVLFCILPFIRNGSYMKISFPILSLLILTASVTPLNLIDIPIKNQIGRLEGVFKKHNLFSEGKILTQNAGLEIPNEEKAVVVDAYDAIDFSELPEEPRWYKDGFVEGPHATSYFDFETAFGFKHLTTFRDPEQKRYYGYDFVFQDQNAIDVSGCSTLYSFYSSSYDVKNNERIVVEYANGKYRIDLSDELKSLVEEKESEWSDNPTHHSATPMIFDAPGGFKLLLTNININITRDSSGNEKDVVYSISGYALK